MASSPATKATVAVDRTTALRHRVRVQQLDRAPGSATDPTDATVLDGGAQDTGPDGALWALALRGVAVTAADRPPTLAYAWTLRGAPHAYRRADLREVEHAVRPWSDADAAKRMFDAARPLKAAGIAPTQALAQVARAMREIVVQPTVKGDLSTALTAAMPEAYLRACRPCGTTHMYEQTFRLAALHAGLELDAGTSPPVLRRIPGWPSTRIGATTPAAPGTPFDLVRTTLHLLGPTTPQHVAAYLDSPVRDVTARWPSDAVAVDVDGRPSHVLAEDLDELVSAATLVGPAARLLGPYDPILQARDRDLLVPDQSRRSATWPVLGRPGAVLAGSEVVGTWRPRTSGGRLALVLDPWVPWDHALRAAVDEQHALLAAFRGVRQA
ncbi:winged helix DNA-binding domain-containing protein [Cellulomonas sp. S1-8]|uniref:winged helix DNA-binding domain-containing protein n=1 Tax=Cellulomonas sp. S1-8 TaxID=2904790 RepID=UPI00224470D4|nr:winged helix DNA-binding domain-containing protein [Cellulomonas sp. S1-8]UZN04889.1 winged helix DNA-binding domain-containing protein [Cellulomonas sp. S1-8]